MLVCMILPKDPLKCSLLFTFHCSDWVSSNILSSRSHMCFSVSPQFSSLQSLSCVQLFATWGTAACQASLSITNSQSLPKHMSIDLVMPCNHLILCHPLLFLPSIFPSIRVFSSDSALHWPKYWSFSISHSNSGLISFRIDWFDLALQRTLKSLLQHHNSLEFSLLCGPTLT